MYLCIRPTNSTSEAPSTSARAFLTCTASIPALPTIPSPLDAMNSNNLNQPMMPPLASNHMAYPQAHVPGDGSAQLPIPPTPLQIIAQMQHFPQQQQAVWQGWQPQMAMGGIGMQQQWVQHPAQFQVRALQPQAAQANPSPPSVAEIATAVTTALLPMLNKTSSSEPTLEDEQLLIDTMKKWKARGLDPCQALEKLHSVNGHDDTVWKDYFLRNLEKLYPKIYPLVAGSEHHTGTSSSSQPRSPQRPSRELPRHSTNSQSHRDPMKRKNASASAKGFLSNPPPTATGSSDRRRVQAANVQACSPAHSTPNRGSSQRTHPVSVSDSMSANRSRRGEPVGEYHVDTLIPPSDPRKKPKAPTTSDQARFSDEERIFFIHFLRWRLNNGRIPSKTTLYKELAKETRPHRSADAWRKHWDNNSELPDKILIEAEKKARQDEEEESEDDSGEEQSDNDADDAPEEDSGDDEKGAPKPGPPRRRRTGTSGVRVTEEDLRAMALYKAERIDTWDTFTTKQGPWVEFADRPKVSKRSDPTLS
ncbi:hypothetical protein C8Q74DRAFT_816465 [Fomes fomentarius]|nr:hypothetical protein C8Q74DRAFT_816465 [Fomes fomentarius]